MRLAKRFKVEKVLDKSLCRPHIETPYLDVGAKVLAATDGMAMAVVPVDVLDSDRSGMVPTQALVECKRHHVPMRKWAAGASAMYRRPSFASPIATEKQRRNISPSFKRGDKGTATVNLSARRLLDLARAIGTERDSLVSLTFKLQEDIDNPCDPILVEPLGSLEQGGVGVLMSCRR